MSGLRLRRPAGQITCPAALFLLPVLQEGVILLQEASKWLQEGKKTLQGASKPCRKEENSYRTPSNPEGKEKTLTGRLQTLQEGVNSGRTPPDVTLFEIVQDQFSIKKRDD